MRYIRFNEIHKLTGLSRTTVWRLERTGGFPQRRLISKASVAWVKSEVVEWLESRKVLGSSNLEGGTHGQ